MTLGVARAVTVTACASGCTATVVEAVPLGGGLPQAAITERVTFWVLPVLLTGAV
jgi:hypothetical protein